MEVRKREEEGRIELALWEEGVAAAVQGCRSEGKAGREGRDEIESSMGGVQIHCRSSSRAASTKYNRQQGQGGEEEEDR
jgi:hypothetical protein